MSSKFVTLKLGIKKNMLDGLLVRLPPKSTTAMISTKNKFAAAPVIISRENIKSGNVSYVFINSGNANACTGKKGIDNCRKIINILSQRLGCAKKDILIMSTGIIGRQLPIKKILDSISSNSLISHSSLKSAATAIMTTDKFPKYISKSYKLGSTKFSFRGICKGAGMIEPNMATMLSFIETDVSISTANIKKYLNYFSNLSFNRISVDGDMSTNDTVVFSSTGDISLDLKNKSVQRKFLSFASEFFVDMASLIVKDGEGATKAVKLNVINSKSLDLAQKVAKKISNSLLVKTAVFGEDPNWGRVMASLGSIQSDYIKPDKVKLLINNILCFTNGLQTKGVTSRLKKSMKNKRIEITINLNNGKYNETMYFCDLSHDYVKINSEYTT